MSSHARLLALFALLTACPAAGEASRAPSAPRNSTMHEFALIFRATHPVDPDALPVRNSAARAWALARRDEGTLHGASPLEADGVIVHARGTSPLILDGAIASVLIVEAKDLESAVVLAKAHPGLAFGTEIEVRPVKSVPPSTP